MASAGFFALRFLAAVGVAVIAYWPLMKVAGWASSKLASWIDTGNLPYYHGRLLWMFPAWFLCVLVLYLAVFPFLGGANPWRLFVAGLGWSDLVRGVLLGIGEASAAMLVAVYALRLAQPLRRRQVGADAALEYRILGQTGWMRSYKSLFEIIPFP